MSFAGKVALITGSSRGIGWATAQHMAQRGATVLLNSRATEDELESLCAQLRESFDGEHTPAAFDVADPSAVSAGVRTIFARHRRLDVLVNNAGVLDDALLGMIDGEGAARTFAINAIGVLNTMQATARLLARDGGGAIVNVASIIGVNGNAGQVAYGGSKAAVIGMTRSAAKELAGSGVRVNAVAPGFIDTDMVRNLPEGVFEQRVASVALGRIGAPSEVASAIGWLASDEASYITGQVLGVDGGMLI
jgi:3-oxoacyl-[acyl-carrier protein] reductase